MDVEDRFKLIFCRTLKISLDSCKNGNIFGWVLEDLALNGFDWNWADLV